LGDFSPTKSFVVVAKWRNFARKRKRNTLLRSIASQACGGETSPPLHSPGIPQSIFLFVAAHNAHTHARTHMQQQWWRISGSQRRKTTDPLNRRRRRGKWRSLDLERKQSQRQNTTIEERQTVAAEEKTDFVVVVVYAATVSTRKHRHG
jgi:hypothetical protein